MSYLFLMQFLPILGFIGCILTLLFGNEKFLALIGAILNGLLIAGFLPNIGFNLATVIAVLAVGLGLWWLIPYALMAVIAVGGFGYLIIAGFLSNAKEFVQDKLPKKNRR